LLQNPFLGKSEGDDIEIMFTSRFSIFSCSECRCFGIP
jgi:hypothetical protein